MGPICRSALAAGVALFRPDAGFSVVTVADIPDPTPLAGSGFAGGVVSPQDFDRETEAASEAARTIVTGTIAALGLEGTDGHVVGGEPGVGDPRRGRSRPG
jgi:hypothetical protein